METYASYLTPNYSENFLPPIIQYSIQNNLNPIQEATSYELSKDEPNNNQTTISEYISSSQPNPIQSSTIKEYKSTVQPNLLQTPTFTENNFMSYSNELQPPIISEYKSTSYPNELNPSTIL